MKFNRIFAVAALYFCLITTAGYAQFEQYGLNKKSFEGRFLVYAEDSQVAQTVKNNVRTLYENIIGKLDYAGAFKTKYQILIWNDRDRERNFLDACHIQLQSKAFFLPEFKGYPTIIACAEKDILERALLHEFTHLVLREFTGSFTRKLPLWLDEGVANYLGSPMLSQYKQTLKTKIQDGSVIPLATLTAMQTYPDQYEEKVMFYIESEALVSFLFANERKKGDFYSFVRRYVNQGDFFTQAYSYVFSHSGTIKKIEEQWKTYVMGL